MLSNSCASVYQAHLQKTLPKISIWILCTKGDKKGVITAKYKDKMNQAPFQELQRRNVHSSPRVKEEGIWNIVQPFFAEWWTWKWNLWRHRYRREWLKGNSLKLLLGSKICKVLKWKPGPPPPTPRPDHIIPFPVCHFVAMQYLIRAHVLKFLLEWGNHKDSLLYEEMWCLSWALSL